MGFSVSKACLLVAGFASLFLVQSRPAAAGTFIQADEQKVAWMLDAIGVIPTQLASAPNPDCDPVSIDRRACVYGRDLMFSKPYFGQEGDPDPGGANREAFIRYMAPIGVWMQMLTGMPASIVIAQAMIETDSGRSKGYRDRNSFFGLSCTRAEYGQPKVYPLMVAGQEHIIVGRCTAKRPSNEGGYYVVFDHPVDSMLAHIYVLLQSEHTSHYKALRAVVGRTEPEKPGTWRRVADTLRTYSGNPNYAADLKQAIALNHLDQYDRGRLCQ